MKDTIGLCLIGAGRAGMIHGRNFARHIPGARMVAVAKAQIHELKSAVILNPGPVAIREGLPALAQLFRQWATAATGDTQ